MLEEKKSGALQIQLALKPWHADLAKHVVKGTTESLNKRQTRPFHILYIHTHNYSGHGQLITFTGRILLAVHM